MTTTNDRSAGDVPLLDDEDEAEASAEYARLHDQEHWSEGSTPQADDLWTRYADDPKRAKRAEYRIAALFVIPVLCGLSLMVVYCLGGQPQAEGALLFFAFASLGVGMVLIARDLLPGNDIAAHRHPHPSSAEQRAAVVVAFNRGLEPLLSRRVLLGSLSAAGGVFGIAALFPLASLGDRPGTQLEHTEWGNGTRAVDRFGNPVKLGQLSVNGVLTVFPEGSIGDDSAMANGQTMLINLGNADFEVDPHHNWTVLDGSERYVAFSKVCTHAGCPVGLFNRSSRQLVCPCHQSTFDVLKRCNPVFGPASRSLPQLPLSLNQDNEFISLESYQEPIGPGFWNRG
jgi:ubiquinol-cytochrome c reductase iron-sulfur subunit